MSNPSPGIQEESRLALLRSTELARLQWEEASTLLLQKNVQSNREDFAALTAAVAQVIATNFQTAVLARK